MQTSPETTVNPTRLYTIARLDKDNIRDLAKLYAAVYGKPALPGYFESKYNTEYTGVLYVGFIAYDMKSQPMAYYGVIPCLVQQGNETMLAAQSADTMTHPEFRYKGMFVQLSNKTFDLCREMGIRLLFGFPNQNSYHGAVTKLGWKMTDTMVCFSVPVKTLPLQRLSGKTALLRKMYGAYRRIILRKKLLPQQGVINSAIQDGFGGVCRNAGYLQYKTYNPTQVIACGKAKAWVTFKNALMIGDMESVDDKNFNATIKRLKLIASWLGISSLQFHASPGTTLHRLFAEKYEATASYPMLFQDFGSPIAPECIRFCFADIDIF